MAVILRSAALLICLFGISGQAHAGLYYSGETYAELPSQWHGFLLDQRLLRNIAVKPGAGVQASPARLRYEDAAAFLEKAKRERKLTADELAIAIASEDIKRLSAVPGIGKKTAERLVLELRGKLVTGGAVATPGGLALATTLSLSPALKARALTDTIGLQKAESKDAPPLPPAE